MTAFTRKIGKAGLAAGIWAVLALAAGCDQTALVGGGVPGGFGGWTGGYWPDWGYYDPTDTIQGVIDYRWEVMDWSNDAWDEYIRQ